MTVNSDNRGTTAERVALFPGTFDPFTIGHASIVERGLEIFDRVAIAIGINANKLDTSDAAARVQEIASLYDWCPRVDVGYYTGLTVDAAANVGARFLLRGVRSAKDFEYERELADINRQLSGIETVILYSLPELASVSSSMVRELAGHGRDISAYLPQKQKLRK